MKKSIKALILLPAILASAFLGLKHDIITKASAEVETASARTSITTKDTTAKQATTDKGMTEIQKINRDHLSQNYCFEIKESSEPVKISKATAIENAKKTTITNHQPSSITVELSRFTYTEVKTSMDSNVVTRNIPAWLVTFHDLVMEPTGCLTANNDNTIRTVVAEMNVIINADTGEWVQAFAYNRL